MKKITLLLITILSASAAFSNELVYCPDLIRCTQAGNVNSCIIIGDNCGYEMRSESGNAIGFGSKPGVHLTPALNQANKWKPVTQKLNTCSTSSSAAYPMVSE